jgi:hypothetical protein
MVEVIRSKKRYNGKPQKVWEFGLEFYRGNDPVVHEFKAYPAMDAGGLSYTLSATHKPERAIEGIVRSIRKMLADDDGTPVDYRPSRYQAAESEDEDESAYQERHGAEPTNGLSEVGDMPEGWQEAARAGWQDNPVAEAAGLTEPEDDAEDDDSLFMGPGNEPITGEQVAEVMRFERGSSRRRFAYLMDEDESLTLDLEQLQTVYKKLLAQVADRPTRR